MIDGKKTARRFYNSYIEQIKRNASVKTFKQLKKKEKKKEKSV